MFALPWIGWPASGAEAKTVLEWGQRTNSIVLDPWTRSVS
jgi:hypothetical protein